MIVVSTACIVPPFHRIRFLGSISMFLEFARLGKPVEIIFFNRKFCLTLGFIHVYERERIVTVPRKIGIRGLTIFPQKEKLFL